MTENGRVALVSGGNRGIGLEIVRQLADKGITTIMGSRDEESGRKAADGLPSNVVVRGLDVLVNNAAISNDGGQRGVDADLERVREALETNLFGAWRLCEVAIPLMQSHGYGRIVNMSTGMAALEDMG